MNNEHLHSEGRPFTKDEFVEKIKTDKNFANRFGNLGRIYGAQWRNWNERYSNWEKFGGGVPPDGVELTAFAHKGLMTRKKLKGIDQIQNLINDLKTNPDSRRLLVSAWNISDLPNMVLPPCHYGFQVYTRELSFDERAVLANRPEMIDDKYYTDNAITELSQLLDENNIPTRAISLMWNQRSVDTFLGLPFNIASYGLLLEIIAKEVNMVADELIGNLGDVHLYSNHIDAAKEQIGRYFTIEERTEVLKQAMGEEAFQTAFDEQVPFGGGLSEYFGKYHIRPNLHTRQPFPLPTFDCPAMDEISHTTFDELVFKLQPCDFYMDDYQSHPTIKAPLSN
jgi:thymidylate synthase